MHDFYESMFFDAPDLLETVHMYIFESLCVHREYTDAKSFHIRE